MKSSLNNILLSIIIPIKDISNWESNILENINLFKKFNINHEFLFVYSAPKDVSTRKLQRILNKEKNIIFCLENGNSIYSAMNKGIESASGTFLIFIGADDLFNKEEIINFKNTLINKQKSDLILFEVLLKGETKKQEIVKNTEGGVASLIHWTLGQPRIHQGIVYKRSYIISKRIKYLTKLKVTSDYIFTSEVFSCKPLIHEENFPIIFFNTKGFSSKSSYTSNYLEHIKGFYLVQRLRKYLFFIIISRTILILYKFIINSFRKFKTFCNKIFNLIRFT